MSYGARLPEPSSAARLACNANSRPNISRSSLISVLCTIVHTILTLTLDISSSDGAFATIAHNGEMTHPERAVMTQSQSAPSVPNLARENAAPADPAFVAKLQQAANLANENCDRATALAHMLSGQLREAQSRINQLELDQRSERICYRLFKQVGAHPASSTDSLTPTHYTLLPGNRRTCIIRPDRPVTKVTRSDFWNSARGVCARGVRGAVQSQHLSGIR